MGTEPAEIFVACKSVAPMEFFDVSGALWGRGAGWGWKHVIDECAAVLVCARARKRLCLCGTPLQAACLRLVTSLHSPPPFPSRVLHCPPAATPACPPPFTSFDPRRSSLPASRTLVKSRTYCRGRWVPACTAHVAARTVLPCFCRPEVVPAYAGPRPSSLTTTRNHMHTPPSHHLGERNLRDDCPPRT